jgi:predicted nucleic acid-binding protein
MKGFPLDTNIPWEMTRPRPQPSVSAWLDDADDDRLYFSVVSLGEILKGVTLLSESRRRGQLQKWLDVTLRPWFAGRILPVDQPIAERWGVLAGQCQMKGRPLKVVDGLIAATALEHDLTVVTRNVKDFSGLGVTALGRCVNPRPAARRSGKPIAPVAATAPGRPGNWVIGHCPRFLGAAGPVCHATDARFAACLSN